MIETTSSRQASSRANVREMSRAKVASRGPDDDLPRWHSPVALASRKGDTAPHKYRNQLTSPDRPIRRYKPPVEDAPAKKEKMTPMKEEQVRIIFSQERKRKAIQEHTKAIEKAIVKKVARRMMFNVDTSGMGIGSNTLSVGGNTLSVPGPTRFNPTPTSNTPAQSGMQPIAGGEQFEVVQFDDGGTGGGGAGGSKLVPSLDYTDELGFNGTMGFNSTQGSRGLPSRGGLATRGVTRGGAGTPGGAAAGGKMMPGGPTVGFDLAKRNQTPSSVSVSSLPMYRASTPVSVKPVTFDKLRSTCSRSPMLIHVGSERPLPILLAKPRRSTLGTSVSSCMAITKKEETPKPVDLKFDKNIFHAMQQQRNNRRTVPSDQVTSVKKNKVSLVPDDEEESGLLSDPAKLEEASGEASGEAAAQTSPLLLRGGTPPSALSRVLSDTMRRAKTQGQFSFPTLNKVPQCHSPHARNAVPLPSSGGRFLNSSASAEYSPDDSTDQEDSTRYGSEQTAQFGLETPTNFQHGNSIFGKPCAASPHRLGSRPSTVMAKLVRESNTQIVPVEITDKQKAGPQNNIQRTERQMAADIIRSHSSML